MFKNAVISAVFAMFSIVSGLAFAATNTSDNGSVSVLSAANSTHNDATLLHSATKNRDIAKNATSLAKLPSAEKSESFISTAWLFVVALFWFVILSNRRGV